MLSLSSLKYGFYHLKKVANIFVLLLSCIIIGVLGYVFIEGYSFLEALYMTVITITTVGFHEVRPLSDIGKIFTMALIVSFIGIFFYGVTTIAGLIIEGEFSNYFRNYKVRKRIAILKNHVIVCGYGRNGKQVCLELADDKQPFVIIENDPNTIEEIKENDKLLFVEGNATEEDILLEAGIKEARAIIATLPDDPDNLYVVLTARELNSNVIIISRASYEASVNKLKRGGANNVIMPEKLGGAHMAALVMKPDIMEFIAQLTGQDNDISLTFEELSLSNISPESIGTSIRDLDIRNKTGANIIGIKLPNGQFEINPLPETILNPNTMLIVLGNAKQIAELRKTLAEL